MRRGEEKTGANEAWSEEGTALRLASVNWSLRAKASRARVPSAKRTEHLVWKKGEFGEQSPNAELTSRGATRTHPENGGDKLRKASTTSCPISVTDQPKARDTFFADAMGQLGETACEAVLGQLSAPHEVRELFRAA